MEVYDCTLREGEQAKGASFSLDNRLRMCKLLDDFGIDYIELGWPVVSQEVFDSFKSALSCVKKAKIVAFGSTSIAEDIDSDKNLKSVAECGAKYACIFGKTDLDHVEKQLGINKSENLDKIRKSLRSFKKRSLIKSEVFYC